MTTLILWRHGITEWNGQQRHQGQQDVPLSPLGHRQAAELAPVLAARDPSAIVSSDLSRAAATAEALARLTGLVVRTDPRLRERGFGAWEGLTAAEIAERFPEASARRRAGDQELGHGIESAADVGKRMGEALRAAATAAEGRTTVVVTHGGAAKCGIFALLGWPLEQAPALSVLANCHYTELRLDPVRGWVMHAHNVGVGAGAPGHEE